MSAGVPEPVEGPVPQLIIHAKLPGGGSFACTGKLAESVGTRDLVRECDFACNLEDWR